MSFASTSSSSSSFSGVGEEKSDKQHMPSTVTTTRKTNNTTNKKMNHYQNKNWQRRYQHRMSPSSSASIGSESSTKLKTSNDDAVRFIVILFDDDYGNFELMDGEENLTTNPTVNDVLSEIHYSTNQPIIRNTNYRGISNIYTNGNTENNENDGKSNHGDEYGPNVLLGEVIEKSRSCKVNADRSKNNKNIHLFVGLPRSLTVEQCIQRGKLILRDSKVENLLRSRGVDITPLTTKEESTSMGGGKNKLVVNNDDDLLSSRSSIMMQRFLLEQSTSSKTDLHYEDDGNNTKRTDERRSLVFSPPQSEGENNQNTPKTVEMVVTLTLFDSSNKDDGGVYFDDDIDVAPNYSKDSTDTTKADVDLNIYSDESRDETQQRDSQRNVTSSNVQKTVTASTPKTIPRQRHGIARPPRSPSPTLSSNGSTSSSKSKKKKSFTYNSSSRSSKNSNRKSRSAIQPSSPNAPMSPVKLFALLIDPESGVFELLQLSIYKHQPNANDLLDKIKTSVTEPSLKAKQPFRLITMDHAKELLQDTPLIHALDNNNVHDKNKKKKGIHLVAIPSTSPSRRMGDDDDASTGSLSISRILGKYPSEGEQYTSGDSRTSSSNNSYHSYSSDDHQAQKEYEAYFFDGEDDDSKSGTGSTSFYAATRVK